MTTKAEVKTTPRLGPEPVLISRKEVEALYDTLAAVIKALDVLQVDYIVTGGSLLGAIRQHSILFCDDDIDIAIIDRHNDNGDSDGGDGSPYDRVSKNLARLLGEDFTYSIRPWEGGDKVRLKRRSSVFLDIFTLRRYDTVDDLLDVIGTKKNGQTQPDSYIQGILGTMRECSLAQNERRDLFPLWHFNTRKAVEMWAKEVYRPHELFPLSTDLKFGPLTKVKGPRMPVLLLKRAFGLDCFDVYYQSGSHKTPKAKGSTKIIKTQQQQQQQQQLDQDENKKEVAVATDNSQPLQPLVNEGGNWDGAEKKLLQDEHYIPMQPVSRIKRRHSLHDRNQLLLYLEDQTRQEGIWTEQDWKLQTDGNEVLGSIHARRPNCTVYMDGVFDLFHIGHLMSIKQCAALGNKIIIGVTGDADATGYKRKPIIPERERVAIVGALRDVDLVVCPCPLVVTAEFMESHGIDLVVHGFANDADVKTQEVFFEIPMKMGKFKRIPYYKGLSTTDIINKIQLSSSS